MYSEYSVLGFHSAQLSGAIWQTSCLYVATAWWSQLCFIWEYVSQTGAAVAISSSSWGRTEMAGFGPAQHSMPWFAHLRNKFDVQ